MNVFNEHGVCTNPECIQICEGVELRIARDNGGFYYGYNVEYHTGGSSGPCTNKGQKFSTRESAIDKALECAMQVAERERDWYRHAVSVNSDAETGYNISLRVCERIIKELKNYRRKQECVQLTLF